jgi:hypothetical protein
VKRTEVTDVLITHPSPYALQELVRRERRRGALIPVAPVTMVQPGLFGVWVEQYRPLRPAWVRPVQVAAAVTLGVGVLVGAGWWLVSLVTGVSLAAVVGVAAVVGAGWMVTRSRGGGCTITVTHRH